MKLLLDEDLDVKLRFRFGPEHEVSTVRQMGWLGKKNGELLRLMLAAGFEVLVTGDQNIPYQQNWRQYPFMLIILVAHPKKYAMHLRLIPQVLATLAQPGLVGGVHVVQTLA